MGNYKALVLGLIGLLLVGCGLRGGQYTLADLQAEYNRAQDAVENAEQLNAEQYAPRLLKLAKDRLSTVREEQLAAPSADVIRQYQYIQTLANRAAMNSLNQRISSVQTDLDQRPDELTVDTSAIQSKLTELESQLSKNVDRADRNAQSLEALTQNDERQRARIDDLEDTVAQIEQLRSQLSQVRSQLTRGPPTKLGDTLTRLLRKVREHDEAIGQLCQGLRDLDRQLTAHRRRIGDSRTGNENQFVYPTNSPGLVGYWPFERNGGKYFEDASGNLSVGRTVGSLEQTAGIFGTRGISFRRSGSLVGVSDHPDLDPGTSSDFAVSTWFNAGSIDGESYLLNKWSARNDIGWQLSLSRTGVNFTMQSGGESLVTESRGSYLDRSWHHVAVVYERRENQGGSGVVKLYVDGSLRDRVTGTISLDTDQYLAIGGSAQETNKYFTGKLDELRIYRRDLSQSEVRSLAADQEVPVSTVCEFSETKERRRTRPEPPEAQRDTQSSRSAPELNRDTGLIAHWPLDDSSDSHVRDRAGNADGVLVGDATAVPGQVNRAMEFRGDTDRIRIDNRLAFGNLEALTVTAWVRPEQYARQYVLTKGIPEDGTMASPYGLFLTESRDVVFSVNTTNGFNQIRKAGYDRGEWMLLAGTYDGRKLTLYVDGEKISELAVGRELTTNDLPIFLGSRYGAFGGFRGQLDDVRLYNYALTEREVNQLPGL